MSRISKQGTLGFTAVEIAVGVAILGALLAAAIPTFIRTVHSSRFVEATDGLAKLGKQATSFAEGRPPADAFPPSAALTPSAPPRGTLQIDPPGTWDSPTWQALAFRPANEGEPHAFSFGFDSGHASGRSFFAAHAHADLDGDGAVSTFEVRGHASVDEPFAIIEPGMYVESEVE